MAKSLTPMLQAVAEILRAELAVAGEPLVLEELREPDLGDVRLETAPQEHASLLISFEQCFKALGSAGNLADWLFPLVRREAPVRQNCDYVLLSEVKGYLCVLLIELKGVNSTGAAEQIANTRLLVGWILQMVARARQSDSSLAAALASPLIRGLIVKPKAPRAKDVSQGLAYLPHEIFKDLHFTTVPYGTYRLRYLWAGQVPRARA